MFTKLLAMLVGILLFIGCSKESNDRHLNQFSFLVDGTPWIVTQSPTDPCMEAFYASESMGPYEVGQQAAPTSYYNIYAFQDPHIFDGVSDVKNQLEIQINNVRAVGTYVITGSDQENFQSYVRFSITTDAGEKKEYKNDQKGSFTFSIESFLPTGQAGIRGIAGHFSGSLYEVSNPSDSIILSQGEYLFDKINWNNFNQCPQ